MANKKTVNKSAMPSVDRSWEVRDAMMTLQRAEQIKKDTSLMSGIKREVANLSKVVNKPRK